MNSGTRLIGRVALVAGGSGGIGGAIARRLAREGAAVVLGARRRPERAEAIAREIEAAGGKAAAFTCDLSCEGDPRRLVEAAHEAFGGVDIVVNASGIALYRFALDTSPAEWRRVMAVNLEGAFFLAQAALPGMVRKGWGRVVNVGSIWGEAGAAGEAAYSASKAGLSGLTKALAKEVARTGVTVNAVAPGVIETEMNSGFDPAERRALLSRIPVGRLGSPEDVAGAVAFLASDEARYVTGHILWVTGGFDPLPD